MRTTTHEEPSTLSICVDCLQFLANGEIGNEDAAQRTTEQLAADIDANWLGVEITLGRIRDAEVVEEIHLTSRIGCSYLSSQQLWDLGREDEEPTNWAACVCDDYDEGSFSYSACHGCSSRLGGDRFHATAWLQIENEETV